MTALSNNKINEHLDCGALVCDGEFYCETCAQLVTLQLMRSIGVECAGIVVSYLSELLPVDDTNLSSARSIGEAMIREMAHFSLSEAAYRAYSVGKDGRDLYGYQSCGYQWYLETFVHFCPENSVWRNRNEYTIGSLIGADPFDVRKNQLFAQYWMLRSAGIEKEVAIEICVRTSYNPQRLKTASPRAIIGRRCLNEMAKDMVGTYKLLANSRLLMVALKAELFRMIVMGKIVAAQNNSTIFERQTVLLNDALYVLSLVIGFICGGLEVLGKISGSLFESIGESRLRAYFELVIFCFAINAIFTVYRKLVTKNYVMKTIKDLGENKFLAKRITNDGILYEFVYDGKLVVIPQQNNEENERRVEEMSLPGSSLFPSAKRSVGAVLVKTEGVELTVVGCFWRLGDHLITAKHVANAVSSGIAEVFLGNHKEGKRGLRRLDLENVYKVEKSFFDIEENEYPKVHDVFARKLSAKQWSQIGICESSTKTRSYYGQTVSAVGFLDGLLVTSAGKTLKGSGVVELYHTASTQKGFSGSPLYSGTSVVGMHIASDCNKNVAIRMELIRYCLTRDEESNRPQWDEDSENWKEDGREVEFDNVDDYDMASYDMEGRVKYRGRGKYKYNDFLKDEEEQAKQPLTSFEKKKQRQLQGTTRGRGSASYRDESAPVNGVIRMGKEKPVHCNKSKSENAEVTAYLNDREEELIKLGYDPTKYDWPEITPETEEVSCVKHMELFNERNNNIKAAPSSKELDRAVQLVTQMMSANKYDAPKGYKSVANINKIINSSVIKSKKSPGHPYQSEGLMTNGCVLKHYGDTFAEVVISEWDTDFFLKLFLKAEPTKKAKLDAKMLRIITGMPLHKTIKNQAVFENFRKSMVDNWEESPVKYSFSPELPGHINHLAKWLGVEEKTYSSDKRNWDYMFFCFLFKAVGEVVCELAIQPDDVSDEEFEAYKADVRQCVKEVNEKAKYRCTNGTVYQSAWDGIMKSGWLLTIDFNSIAQLLVDVLIKIRLGWDDKQIYEYKIVVGGDDVIQTFPHDIDTDKYLEEASKMGFDLAEFEVTKGFEGCEFFSTRFQKRDGVWTFHPLRFTKCVKRLRTTKIADLAGALSSHMMNYAWSNNKYRFFYDMYRKFRKDNPDLFPASLLKTQKQLQYKLTGAEVDC